MKQIEISNRCSTVMLVAFMDGTQLITPFHGGNIDGAVQVVKEHFHKNGKWSYYQWTLQCADNVWFMKIPDGQRHASWQAAIDEWKRLWHYHNGADAPQIDDEAIRRHWRHRSPAKAAEWDKIDSTLMQPSQLPELLAAQIELADAQKELQAVKAEVNSLRVAEELKAAAEQTRTKVAKAKAALSKGSVNLADLQAMLSQ